MVRWVAETHLHADFISGGLELTKRGRSALYLATEPSRRTGSAAPSQTGPPNNEGDSRNEYG